MMVLGILRVYPLHRPNRTPKAEAEAEDAFQIYFGWPRRPQGYCHEPHYHYHYQYLW